MNMLTLYIGAGLFLLAEAAASLLLLKTLSRKAEQQGGPNLGPLVAAANLLFAIVIVAVAIYLLADGSPP